ncbi:MAG: hypothetical protein ACR2FV_16710 [Ornithinimicrobium sp.]|jgi:hypothetical protein|uniref:hypothetical protein n=1 Tax=Ornithinimicrobium sp. TaxID=1977084 RepID=UPI003D9AE1FF
MSTGSAGRFPHALSVWGVIGVLDTIAVLALFMVQAVWAMVSLVVAVLLLTALAEQLTPRSSS